MEERRELSVTHSATTASFRNRLGFRQMKRKLNWTRTTYSMVRGKETQHLTACEPRWNWIDQSMDLFAIYKEMYRRWFLWNDLYQKCEFVLHDQAHTWCEYSFLCANHPHTFQMKNENDGKGTHHHHHSDVRSMDGPTINFKTPSTIISTRLPTHHLHLKPKLNPKRSTLSVMLSVSAVEKNKQNDLINTNGSCVMFCTALRVRANE